MRSYCAVHVDVGYLLASAATFVTGSSLRRGIAVDYPTLIARLVEQAETDSGLPLLRVNWYDSGARPGGMPDYQQDEIGLLSRVKLRLGRLSYSGDQKGVDIRIGLDLAIQGRNRVADVVYLVSGDDDLTEAVEEAQSPTPAPARDCPRLIRSTSHRIRRSAAWLASRLCSSLSVRESLMGGYLSGASGR